MTATAGVRGNAVVGLRIRVRGVVQGVGFRPFIYRLAHEYALTGSVANVPDGVVIHVNGDPASLDRFVDDIERRRPPLAHITSLETETAAVEPAGGFVIAPSAPGAERAGRALIPSDIGVCDACLAELFDPRDRRYRYPFINCTDCGPRYTIITGLPYDRPLTTMARFAMCEACRAEYEDPLNRRFHAEPVACPACGPRLTLTDATGRPIPCDDAVAETVRRLLAGQIVAVKGIGGFHLAVDATSDAAVARLRDRKRREQKPLALMAPSVARVREFCRVREPEAALLSGPEKPIVLLDRIAPGEASPVAAGVAPGQVTLGVMLPYTPLHALLFDSDLYALVLTSGNLSEEPIACRNGEALARLAGIADVFLVHDRDIHRHADDSVARVTAGEPRLMRRGRGYAPRPITLTREAPPLLAVGGQLKNTVCVTRGREAFLSPHIGDLENLETYRAFETSIDHLIRSLGVAPVAIAHDLHPDYASTRWARRQSERPLVPVQHHHAHVAAVLAEHGVDGPVVGVVLDGTGYGTDGRIWGGEILVADLVAFTRAAHIPYVPMLGGEAAAREPWRMAVAWLDRVFHRERFRLPPPLAAVIDERRIRRLLDAHRSGVAFPQTSSCGRLFDAVAALCGVRFRMSYEGQAALDLEGAAEMWLADHAPLFRSPAQPASAFDTAIDAIVRAAVEEMTVGLTPGEIAAHFHVRLSDAIADAAIHVAARAGLRTVALGGGCFQNRLLLGGVSGRLRREGLDVLIATDVPVNDGGVALGQAAVAAARLNRNL